MHCTGKARTAGGTAQHNIKASSSLRAQHMFFALTNVFGLGSILIVLISSNLTTIRASASSNLLLQSQTVVYRLITGKGRLSETSSSSIGDAEARIYETCVHSARDPTWMLRYGPAGDLPMHLAFLLGKKEIGLGMLQALENLNEAEQTAYWHCCYGLHAKYPETVDPVPQQRGIRELIGWVINLPYQSDISWWFREVARRERAGNEGVSDLLARFSSLVHHSKVEEVLTNDAGLFTGETIIHIAISFRDHELVDWLMERGARLDARAVGIFFQPKHIATLSDNSNSRWFWQPQLEDNENAGCYYGEYPLSFAASIGDADLATLLIDSASFVIDADDHKATAFMQFLDRKAKHLLAQSEGFHMLYANASDQEQRSRRLSAFINVQDTHGNTALHMAVMHHQRHMVPPPPNCLTNRAMRCVELCCIQNTSSTRPHGSPTCFVGSALSALLYFCFEILGSERVHDLV